MNKFYIVISFLVIQNFAYADKSLKRLNGLFKSKERASISDVPNILPIPDKPSSKRMTSSLQCKEKDQNSLPLRYLIGLLRNKGAVLTPTHDVETSTLKIFGGPMIGNCNSMLEYIISEPTEELPYVFQVKIKGCGKQECEYSVKEINDSDETVEKTVKVAPNMNGFFKCLEETGVMKNGKVIKDKIVVSEMKAVKTGAAKAGELWFASHGPEAQRVGAVFSEGGNKLSRDDCFYFEDIQQDGYRIYSKVERMLSSKRKEFEKLCESDNYKIIDKRIGEFSQIKEMKKVLEEVRNDLLKVKVKELVGLIKENDDYSGLDAEEINEVFSDFNKYIIQDLKDELFGVYQNGSIIKKGLYHKIMDQSDKEEKSKMISEFMKKLNELNKYTKPPFPSASTAKLMESYKKRAPLDDENWYEAVLTLNESLNTVIGLTNPYKKMLTRYQSRKGHKFKKLPGVRFSKVKREVRKLQGKLARRLATKRKMVADSDYRRSKDLKSQAKDIRRTSQDNLKVLRQEVSIIQQRMAKECCYDRGSGQFDSQCASAKYYRNLQRCALEYEQDLQNCYKKIKRMNDDNEKIARSLDQEAQSWVSLEKSRDKYYDYDDEEDEVDISSERVRGNSYTPGNSSQIRSSFDLPQRGPAMQQRQMNPWQNPMMQQRQMNPWQFQMMQQNQMNPWQNPMIQQRPMSPLQNPMFSNPSMVSPPFMQMGINGGLRW